MTSIEQIHSQSLTPLQEKYEKAVQKVLELKKGRTELLQQVELQDTENLRWSLFMEFFVPTYVLLANIWQKWSSVIFLQTEYLVERNGTKLLQSTGPDQAVRGLQMHSIFIFKIEMDENKQNK